MDSFLELMTSDTLKPTPKHTNSQPCHMRYHRTKLPTLRSATHVDHLSLQSRQHAVTVHPLTHSDVNAHDNARLWCYTYEAFLGRNISDVSLRVSLLVVPMIYIKLTVVTPHEEPAHGIYKSTSSSPSSRHESRSEPQASALVV